MSSYVPDQLRKAAEIFEERNKLYGDNYKYFGPAFWPLLGEVRLESASDLSRFGVLVQILSKVTRYCENFNRGGHADSLDDLAVYAIMLSELDLEIER